MGRERNVSRIKSGVRNKEGREEGRTEAGGRGRVCMSGKQQKSGSASARGKKAGDQKPQQERSGAVYGRDSFALPVVCSESLKDFSEGV